jgi:signal transduction histidine kinase
MIIVRWIAVPWAFVQVLSFEVPYPPGYKAVALGIATFLAAANVAIWLLHRRPDGRARAHDLAIAGLVIDGFVLSSLVWLFAFDYQTQVWALLGIAPLEGAIMFQLRGAIGTWVPIAIIYTARDIWAADRYGNPLIWNSISFRMGIGGIIALVAGLMARDLMRERTQLEVALEEIKRIDKMRSGLVSMLGHDVRSPLTVIRGVVETLLARGDAVGETDRRSLLESADRQARRLERLATDLLDLARLDQGRMELDTEVLDVKAVVEEALSYVDGADNKIDVKVQEGLTMRADPRRFEQVVINLATNALTHGEPPIMISGTTVNGRASLAVSDRGPGVDESELAELFEPFSTERKSGSVGYGLAIVKALVEAQDGTITYEKNPPGGALFRISLPTD